ncbi:MAG: GTPase Era [Pseudomonadota bacterium]
MKETTKASEESSTMVGSTPEPTRCGHVAIIGRPNVGKSTLLNALLGVKLAAIADKPQTTWHNIRGILTEHDAQIIFVDTPGIHLGRRKLLNEMMNANALGALNDVDVILYLIEDTFLNDEGRYILSIISKLKKPCLLGINKADLYKQKSKLLPVIARLNEEYDFDEILPISAKTGLNLDALKQALRRRLPVSEYHYPEDQISDRSSRFFVTEYIREQLVRYLGDELPYSIYVEVEEYQEHQDRISIAATLWVSSPSQKAIVIGKQGSMIKLLGTRARQSIERLVDKKVFLKLWVKTKQDWQNDPKVIAGFDSRY